MKIRTYEFRITVDESCLASPLHVLDVADILKEALENRDIEVLRMGCGEVSHKDKSA